MKFSIESVHPKDPLAMSAESEEARKNLVSNLLRKVHEQSASSPERAPFWRDGRWRCEFHKNDGSPRLKVFQGDVCVHEEFVQGRSTPEDRSNELKRVFSQSLRGGEDDTLLK